MRILQLYKKASGQQVNMKKFSVFFSSITREKDKVIVKQLLNIHKCLDQEKYLGLPIVIGKNKSVVFRSIKERIRAR